MAHHKRKRPKNRRAGCLLCKPWKMNGFAKGRVDAESLSDHRRRFDAEGQLKEARVEMFHTGILKYNIPPKQRRIQQLVAQFNADEELWFSLESKRRRRRTLHPRMPAKLRRQLDLLEFASARPPQDCIGFWQATPKKKDRCQQVAHQQYRMRPKESGRNHGGVEAVEHCHR